MSEEAKTSGPCSGLRVLELGSMVSAPLAGQILADMGAEVIKIEPPEGDPMRRVGPFHKGMGALFMTVNRGKKSMVLDLKSPRDLELAMELALSSDVLIHNMRPRVMDRLGLGYEALRGANPKLIYTSISGFGESGPYASKPAYDHVLQGMTGVMYLQGRGDTPEPIRNLMVDKSTATITAGAILAALLHRERTDGRGQRIDASLLNAFSWFGLTDNIGNYTFQTPDGQKAPPLDIHHPLRTSDGWVIGHIQTDDQFAAACRLFDREDLMEDETWKSAARRIERNGDMWRELGRKATAMTRAEVLARAESEGVALGPIYTLDEFFADPQVRSSHVYVDHEDPEFGVVRQMNFPVRFERSTIDVGARAPLLGEHTEEILRHAKREAADR
ncbi:CoA transferase [Burkholderia sp. Ac-20353]|uniref:CaiB/BaiF CoA transferase family protein n=1 Tax=Burkholderia sp. Ac-20353 TaxID=2703894 RepID=UPI00197B59B2|nr:CoA transferase [Burkholderia sp. Ac-20353]MBN3785325.1 CoA transferase [Burkholderia sp. Ac-20353]